MTEEEWLTCDDTESLLEFLSGKASGRKLRLFVVACRRALFRLDGVGFTFKETPEDQESYADSPTVLDAISPTKDLSLSANEYAQGFAWAAHFHPNGCSDQPFAPVDRYSVEQAFQCVLLREIFGNPFRRVTLEHTWHSPAVEALSQAAYFERHVPSGHLDLYRLAVLADALEEAGCSEAEIVTHLRSQGPHVRGCWALDLVLGKE